jgi:hypothetical protein
MTEMSCRSDQPVPNQSVEQNAAPGWPASMNGFIVSSSHLRECRFQRVAHLLRYAGK